jgi:hypothetical protein
VRFGPLSGFSWETLHVPGRNPDARHFSSPRLIQTAGQPAGHRLKRPPVKPIVRLVLTLPLLVFALAACGKKIGDECRTQFDCNDEDDTRSCDISQPGGYCTIEGCDERSCPEDSVCIRFFPRAELLPMTCNAVAPDRGASECTPDQLCLDAGRCAPRATEMRRCVKSCGDNGDCRSGYECRLVGGDPAIAPGSAGAIPREGEAQIPLTSIPLTSRRYAQARYCAPVGD